jgi:hypothetical protein
LIQVRSQFFLALNQIRNLIPQLLNIQMTEVF